MSSDVKFASVKAIKNHYHVICNIKSVFLLYNILFIMEFFSCNYLSPIYPMFVERVTNLLWFHKFFLAAHPSKTMVIFIYNNIVYFVHYSTTTR